MADMNRFMAPKLNDSNYGTWAARMECHLVNAELWAAVGAAEHAASAKAKAQIGLAVEDRYLSLVMGSDSAKDAWDALKGVFAAQSSARKLALKKELNSLCLAAEESTSAFVARAKALGEAMAAAGYELPDEEIIMSLLAGLPEDYDMLVTTLTMRGGELSLEETQTALLQYEQQLQARKARDSASSASSSKGPPAKAYAADGRRQKRGGRGSKASIECYYCHKLGHIAADCYKRKEDESKGAGSKPAASFSAAAY